MSTDSPLPAPAIVLAASTLQETLGNFQIPSNSTSLDPIKGLAPSTGASDDSKGPSAVPVAHPPRSTRPAWLTLGSAEPTSTATTFNDEGRPSGFEYIDRGTEDRFDGRGFGGRITGARSFEWNLHGSASPATPLSLTKSSHQTWKRKLGPTELSYYLGSRGEGHSSGVNDMYLHIGFKAKSSLVSPDRVLSIWTELVTRHGLLGCTVEYAGFDSVYFVYHPPKSEGAKRRSASELMEMRTDTNAKELLDNYLNGPRTLSDSQLSRLIISTPASSFTDSSDDQEFDFFLFTTHFLGDGMALHTSANEFFTLLSGDGDNIEKVLSESQSAQSDSGSDDGMVDDGAGRLALPVELRIAQGDRYRRLAWAAARVDFERNEAKLIGGQTFPRPACKSFDRHTLVPTISYSSSDTKTILGTCKKNASTISHAVFALVNVAFIRSGVATNKELPMMVYSALNVRPWLKKDACEDWFHIAIGYYNIILPSFLPSTATPAQTFWQRALATRQQTFKVVKSSLLLSRTKIMALERERRSVGFEMEDERRRLEKQAKGAAGLGIMVGGVPLVAPEMKAVVRKPVVAEKKVPSTALMGLSMLGNLDAMYAHKSYTNLSLHTLTTGSRQRQAAILLFAYTFAGKFWLSLGYDSLGFKEGVVEGFWDELQKGVGEFLLS
ncbi:hypothetical protein MNV49_004566 [Pseudohyphozyma bogoriensis]|nr:hypothetical protein MNV49_004566 [Pseudohyphozyma bogoriensis]